MLSSISKYDHQLILEDNISFMYVYLVSRFFQTGADGCICYLEYETDRKTMEFTGMKQVKELSLIQSVSTDSSSANEFSSCHCAAGFASVDFIIWNIITETKVYSLLVPQTA